MAVSVVTDQAVLPTLVKLLDSLTAWWAAQPSPVKVVGLRWGTDYSGLMGMAGGQPVDEACEGICWVRFVSMGESRSNFPATGGNASPCGPAMWAVTLEIGVQRCADQWPKGDDIPTDAQQAALVAQQCTDMAVVRRAVQCTVLSPGPGAGQNIAWGAQAPLPIDGNVTGSTLQVTVPVLNVDGCGGC